MNYNIVLTVYFQFSKRFAFGLQRYSVFSTYAKLSGKT